MQKSKVLGMREEGPQRIPRTPRREGTYIRVLPLNERTTSHYLALQSTRSGLPMGLYFTAFQSKRDAELFALDVVDLS